MLRFLLLSSTIILSSAALAQGGGADNAAAELAALDASLAQTQDDRRQGRIEAKAYQEAIAAFRMKLETTVSQLEPSLASVALHARILSRLGDSKEAFAALGAALERDTDSADLRVALSQVHLDQKNYPAALAEANAVLERDPGNKDALAVKFSSEGRSDPARAASGESAQGIGGEAGAAAGRDGAAVVVAPRPRDPQPAVVPSLEAPRQSAPVPDRGGAPVWPVAPAAGLAVAAYAVIKSRKTVESEDGFNENDRPQPGRLQEFVAGAILAGTAGAVLYLGGAYAVAAGVPVASRFLAGPGKQAIHLAQSEAGSINLGKAKVVNEVPRVLARVIPFPVGSEIPPTIGKQGDLKVFVTAADDIAGLNARQLAASLGIQASDRYLVMRFPAPRTAIATPIMHHDPQFVGRGLTIGKAREFVMPNVPIPSETTLEIIK